MVGPSVASLWSDVQFLRCNMSKKISVEGIIYQWNLRFFLVYRQGFTRAGEYGGGQRGDQPVGIAVCSLRNITGQR